MKVCIIGSSGHYQYALDGIKVDGHCQVVGIAPGSQGESLTWMVDELSHMGMQPPIYEDYIEMLDKLKPDIAVINCYFGDHAKVTMEALERGIHVFVEKPMATTLEDLERIERAYGKSGAHLMTMLGIRYAPHFLTAWHLVQEGSIGKVRLMNAQKSYKLGSRSSFYKNRDTYGGTIPWVGSHAIDWLYWFSGERFVKVFASHSKQYNDEHGDLESTALCHFTFTNEVFGGVNVDYLRPKEAIGHADDRIRIAGTQGIIEVRDEGVYLINDRVQGPQELPLECKRQIFTDFLGWIREENKPLIDAQDSFIVTEACLRARLSADTEEIIRF